MGTNSCQASQPIGAVVLALPICFALLGCDQTQDRSQRSRQPERTAEIAASQPQHDLPQPTELQQVDHATDRETIQVFQPREYAGKAVRGGLGQELTDGTLTVKVTGVEKQSYPTVANLAAKVTFQYVVTYTLENRGSTAVKVKHFGQLFYEPSGVLAVGWDRKNLKQDGNNYSDTDEPFVYKPGYKGKTSMATRGECEKLNNVCLHVFYDDGDETMFVVYIPRKDIVEKAAAH